MPSVDIPMGSEFSPNVIDDFSELLRMMQEYVPNRKALQTAIDVRFFPH